jgi:hypothetical protein
MAIVRIDFIPYFCSFDWLCGNNKTEGNAVSMNKKADFGTLAMILIVLASAAVLGAFVVKFSTSSKCEAKVEACKLSILSNAQIKKIKAGSPISAIKCPRNEMCEVLLKKKDIVRNDKIDQNKAHRIIADAMTDCWKMVGEGKYDPFSNWEDEGESYCLFCKPIRFDDALKEYIFESENNEKIAKQRGVNGFITSPIPYLISHEYKNGKTYWQYLYKSDPDISQDELAKMSKSVVSDRSYIMLTMHKFDEKSTFWNVFAAVGGLILVVVGGILTATKIGAIIGIPLIKIGSGLIAAGIIAAAVFIPLGMNAFSECEECNAVGGIALVSPDQDPYQTFEVEVEGEKYDIPLCTLLVN